MERIDCETAEDYGCPMDVEGLLTQRDALVAACKDLVDAIEQDWDDLYVEQSVQAGRTALALTKEGTSEGTGKKRGG